MRSSAHNHGDKFLVRVDLKGKKRETSLEKDRPRKKVSQKKYRYEFSLILAQTRPIREECVGGMVPRFHANYAAVKDVQILVTKEVCIKHGAMLK